MNAPKITGGSVSPLLENRFLKVYDLQYEPGKHYYNASRRSAGDLAAVKTDEEFKAMLPDAVTCIVILKTPGSKPVLLLDYEYRYPAGRFLLSPPAGLLDPGDKAEADPLIAAAKREITEETGILLDEKDRIFRVSPLVFSSPGMTDESNGLVCAVAELPDLGCLSQDGAVDCECFNGFRLVDEERAKALLALGTDEAGIFYSVYTWIALAYFVSGAWIS